MTERIFPATDEALPEALAFVEEELDKLDCPLKTVMQITVCVEEMFVNVAHYAYENIGETGTVCLTIDSESELFTITLTDTGMPFNPLEKEDPDITLSADERKIGGLGIFMVKKSMNEVAYTREGNKNIFTMKKKIF